MKCKFVVPEGMASCKERRLTPRASDVILTDAVCRAVPPSTRLLRRLGNPDHVVAFDVETHGWRDKSSNKPDKGRVGRFNWYTLKEEEDIRYARIIQLGWVIGPTMNAIPVDAKSILIKPGRDVQVSGEAANFHKITNERLTEQGRPLEDVLREFMADVEAACERGARLVAHQDT